MVQRNSGAVRAAAGVAIVGAVVGFVGVAGAAEEQRAAATIGTTPQNRFEPAEVSIQTGEAVTWNFDGSTASHNVYGESGPEEDPNWVGSDSGFKVAGTYGYRFNVAGDYKFVCQAHPGMEGVVKVSGAPVEPTPTPEPTQDAPLPPPAPVPTTQPPAPAPTPAGDEHRTPAPQGTIRTDTTPPTLSRLKLKAVRRGAKVSFRLSEPATVTIRAKRGKRTVRTLRRASRSGSRTITVTRLKAGRYTVSLEARDARGNQARVQRKTVRVKR